MLILGHLEPVWILCDMNISYYGILFRQTVSGTFAGLFCTGVYPELDSCCASPPYPIPQANPYSLYTASAAITDTFGAALLRVC